MSDRKKYYPCDECYTQASEQVKHLEEPEEQGHLAYEFLHYEFNHGHKERMFPDLYPATDKVDA